MSSTSLHASRLVSLGRQERQALDAIRAAGGRPFLVGGCVRDPLIGPSTVSKDIDVEVHGPVTVGAVAEALAGCGRVDEVGRSFGVLKVWLPGGMDLDVSLPRRDSKTGAGHRGFAVETNPSIGLLEASGRRDFTVNALMWDPRTGEVIDYWGGLRDIEARVLRHTTEAFAEDPLRVLRGVQFAARFGYTLAPQTAALCRSLAGAYAELPVERVWGEVEKLATKGRHVSAGLEALRAAGWEHHLPQLAALHGVPQDPQWHPEGDVWVHAGLAADQAARLADNAGLTGRDRAVIVLAALVHDLGKVTCTQPTRTPDGRIRITSRGHAEAGAEPARGLLRSVGCPGDLADRIVPIVREHMCCVTSEPSPAAVRRLARRLAPATLEEWALVCAADHAGRGDPAAANPALPWLQTAVSLGVEEHPAKGLLTGHDLIDAGLTPGPEFGPILRAALEAQDAGKFADEAGAIRWLQAQLDARGALGAHPGSDPHCCGPRPPVSGLAVRGHGGNQ